MYKTPVHTTASHSSKRGGNRSKAEFTDQRRGTWGIRGILSQRMPGHKELFSPRGGKDETPEGRQSSGDGRRWRTSVNTNKAKGRHALILLRKKERKRCCRSSNPLLGGKTSKSPPVKRLGLDRCFSDGGERATLGRKTLNQTPGLWITSENIGGSKRKKKGVGFFRYTTTRVTEGKKYVFRSAVGFRLVRGGGKSLGSRGPIRGIFCKSDFSSKNSGKLSKKKNITDLLGHPVHPNARAGGGDRHSAETYNEVVLKEVQIWGGGGRPDKLGKTGMQGGGHRVTRGGSKRRRNFARHSLGPKSLWG